METSRQVVTNRLPAVYRKRDSQKAIWEREYPHRMQDVAWLLGEICEAFGFLSDARFQFSPDDRLNEIYRHRYPKWKFWEFGDCLELEAFAMEFEKRIGSCDPKIFDLPLREIVG